ncbi:hypothetical protein JHW43_008793 [Diplocarpon mali]|nr:hypothetical protein JHW43_008793 [Diplocarpon mali]
MPATEHDKSAHQDMCVRSLVHRFPTTAPTRPRNPGRSQRAQLAAQPIPTRLRATHSTPTTRRPIMPWGMLEARACEDAGEVRMSLLSNLQPRQEDRLRLRLHRARSVVLTAEEYAFPSPPLLVEIRAAQRTFEGAYIRTALGQFSFALVVLKIFTAEFYSIGALFATYGLGVLMLSLYRRYEGNRQFFSEVGENGADSKRFRTSGNAVVVLTVLSVGAYASLIMRPAVLGSQAVGLGSAKFSTGATAKIRTIKDALDPRATRWEGNSFKSRPRLTLLLSMFLGRHIAVLFHWDAPDMSTSRAESKVNLKVPRDLWVEFGDEYSENDLLGGDTGEQTT